MFLAALAFAGHSAAAQDRPCDPPGASGPSRDLYCLELLPVPGLPSVAARIELSRRPGPFTVDVAPGGRPRTLLILTAQGLPPPGSLGGYRRFVAWIAPPTMDSVLRLGPVANGRTVLGTTELEGDLTASPAAIEKPSTVFRTASPTTRPS